MKTKTKVRRPKQPKLDRLEKLLGKSSEQQWREVVRDAIKVALTGTPK